MNSTSRVIFNLRMLLRVELLHRNIYLLNTKSIHLKPNSIVFGRIAHGCSVQYYCFDVLIIILNIYYLKCCSLYPADENISDISIYIFVDVGINIVHAVKYRQINISMC